jgi:hypothetical protein
MKENKEEGRQSQIIACSSDCGSMPEHFVSK